MQIDKGSFVIFVAALGAGGAGGYFASERHLLVPAPPPPPAPTPLAPPKESVAPQPPALPPSKPAPTCDDAVGSPGACPPPIWPSEEGIGGCGMLPTKRCEDFKQAMRPRVAEHAVACINALNAAQRCDPNRLTLCGHTALMSSCAIDEAVDADAAPDEVATQCAAIVHGCEGVALAPTMRDCHATLSGLSAVGREKMTACMKTHCNDKGLLFCEAQLDPK